MYNSDEKQYGEQINYTAKMPNLCKYSKSIAKYDN